MACETCKSAHDKMESIPFAAHESIMARMERANKRMALALIIAIVLMFASNAAWLYAWFQYDYSTEAVFVDSQDSGNANYIGEDGDIFNNG